MLVQLAIRDIVLIDRLDLGFGSGLSVLTGETGAGKSILLDSLSLALGARGDGGLVRHGQGQGQVTAVFDVPLDHPARAAAREADLDVEGDLILRRVQHADGRTRALVNDQPVSAQVMRGLGRLLVEIHGQHDDRALIDPATHRAMLDAYGGASGQLEAVRAAHAALAGVQARYVEHRAQVEKARKEADYLRHSAEELAALAPEAGEEATLAERRQAMQGAEKVAKELAETFDAVGGQGACVAVLSAAVRRLERRGAQAPALVDPPVRALDVALVALDEARDALEQAMREADFDPRELERAEERLFALRAAARKYDTPADELAALAERFAGDVDGLDSGEKRLGQLQEEVRAADAAFLSAARALSATRHATARGLDAAVGAELPPLKLDRARFITKVETDEATRSGSGIDRAEFWVQTNPGTKPGPMVKVASGGELSRFMLALKVVLADRASAPTLVFDEIDTGVGGAVADAIGQRLARLAGAVQVMAVTHAPQVAARAARHLLIAKESEAGGERVATRVRLLEETSRREEIARMLAGASVTEEARAAAGRLLDAAVKDGAIAGGTLFEVAGKGAAKPASKRAKGAAEGGAKTPA